MLFRFNYDNLHDFTTEGMRFPIDVIFVRASRVLYVREQMLADDYVCDWGDRVLEVNGDWARAHGVAVGQRVVFRER